MQYHRALYIPRSTMHGSSAPTNNRCFGKKEFLRLSVLLLGFASRDLTRWPTRLARHCHAILSTPRPLGLPQRTERGARPSLPMAVPRAVLALLSRLGLCSDATAAAQNQHCASPAPSWPASVGGHRMAAVRGGRVCVQLVLAQSSQRLSWLRFGQSVYVTCCHVICSVQKVCS